MMNMTNKEQGLVIRRVSKAISCIQDGEDAVAVLSRIYCENLPDKSPIQGQMMAGDLLRWIKHFQSGYDRALQDPEAYLHQCIHAALADLPSQQRETEAAGFFQKLSAQPDLFAGSGALFLERQEAKQAVGEDMALAVTAMVLYTMAKNGELSGLPQETTLAQVALCTCAEDKAVELQFAKKNGFLEEETVSSLLRSLRSAFYGLIATAAAIGGGALIVNGLGALVSLSAGILLWVGGSACVVYQVFGKMAREEQLPQIPIPETAPAAEDVPTAAARKTLPKLHQNTKTRRATETQKEKNTH